MADTVLLKWINGRCFTATCIKCTCSIRLRLEPQTICIIKKVHKMTIIIPLTQLRAQKIDKHAVNNFI
jgi:hypothetical protein